MLDVPRSPRVAATLLTVAVAAAAPLAHAQDTPPALTEDAGPGAEGKVYIEGVPDEGARPAGWTKGLALGAQLNLNDSREVIGTQNGTSFTAGYIFDGELLFNEGMHEWRNSLRAAAGATRAPAIGEFVKTNDALDFETIYLLHLVEWAGPFARFALSTTQFAALDVRPAPVTYAVADLEGNTTNLTGRRLDLTDPFSPMILKQSIGAFVQPLNEDWMALEARLGLGAQEGIVAEGNLAIADDAATADVVEVKTLDDYYLIGGEGVVNARGFFDEDKRLSYLLGLGVIVPFAASDLPPGDDRNLVDLTTVEGIAGLNAKLTDWASFNYRLDVKRQPLLVDAWQVQNMALLTFSAAWGSKAPVDEPECDCPPVPPPPAAPANEPTAPGEAPPPAAAPATPAEPAAAPIAPAPAPAEPAPAPAP
jgi:hypothetical protein